MGHRRYSKALYYKRDSGDASRYTAAFDLRREAGSAPKSGCSSGWRSGVNGGFPYLVSYVMPPVGIGALLTAITHLLSL
jgi:hypothetical protein